MDQKSSAKEFLLKPNNYALWVDQNEKTTHCVILYADGFDEDGDPTVKVKNIENEYAPYIRVKVKDLNPISRPRSLLI